nr:MAG TPA: hypothetical protein [Siphoviridae sp. ctjRi1]
MPIPSRMARMRRPSLMSVSVIAEPRFLYVVSTSYSNGEKISTFSQKVVDEN